MFSSSCRQRSLGFTLLEVMITVVIVSILAMVALPSYEYFITRSRIVEATTALGDMRSQMEKYFMDNRTYRTPGGKCGIDAAVTTYNTVPSNKFALGCNAPDDVSYEIKATGGGVMNSFEYTINQQNVKATNGTKWGKTSTSCWVTRSDGNCL
jgi:type IV pilus assembly protein PilE